MPRSIAIAAMLLTLLWLGQANSRSITVIPESTSYGIVVCPAVKMPCNYQLAYESSQSQNPFLFYSKIVDSDHPLYRDYSDALGRFDAVGDCWMKMNHELLGNPVRNFDWSRMKTPEELEVCFFRLFNSFHNRKKTMAWLTEAGFEIAIRKEQKANMAEDKNPRKTVFSINGSMNSKTAEKAGATQFFRRFRGWFGHVISFRVEFNAEDLVEHVGVTVIRK